MGRLTLPDDTELQEMWGRVDSRAARDERLRRRHHRAIALVAGVAVAALVTAGAIVLTAPEPPPPLSPTEAHRIYELEVESAWAQLLQEFPNAERPDVELVEFVDRDELLPTHAACIRDLGFAARMEDDGSMSGFVGTGQLEAYEIAMFTCRAMYAIDPSTQQPLNQAEVDYLYRYFVDSLVPCMSGYGVDVGAIPTIEEFRATAHTDKWWSPYLALAPNDPDIDFEAVIQACPGGPADLRRG